MDYSQFSQLNDQTDMDIIEFGQQTYLIGCKYDEIASSLLKRCTGKMFEHEADISICDGSNCAIIRSKSLYIDVKTGEVIVQTIDGKSAPFKMLMIEAKEMLINYLHIHVKTADIHNNFFNS
ncbi:MAG: hypothetical protein JXK07_09155 [Spirochaetes bacterium]|nr:hypothetical protein [Spirochaetota bacterium]MBN2772195.1 hypothetical protein [Spirochaetota bacterium]